MTSVPPDHGASFAVNRQVWDAWTAVHATGDFYDLDGATDFLAETEPGSGRFRLPADPKGELPLMLSLLATKPLA